ncbi:MAG: hypothetical protein ACOCZL_00295 [Bacteroidota bacterium]
MDKNQVKKLVEVCGLPDSCKNAEIKETHISWIILTDNYAFKIKRPVKYSFLDFSSLEQRKHFCYEELKLNRRIEPEMYVKVLPVTKNMSGEAESDDIIEYAVQMKRLDNEKEMFRMLENDQVNEKHIDKLSEKISGFHKNAQVIKNAFDTTGFHEKYADISSQYDFIEENFGKEKKDMVSKCVEKSYSYLNKKRAYFNERVISGYRKDVHGDLNASNIFLYDPPVIFDCIEFNKEYRHIDILNEMAFLSVDLDFFEKYKLAERLFERYCNDYGLGNPRDHIELFTYYKSYRANIRAKVSLINAQKTEGGKSREIEDAERYLDLMKSYCEEIETLQ